LADITPTILYLLGETVPAYMDGRVLTEAIAPSYLSRQPPPPAPKDHRRGVRTAGVGPDNS